MSRYDGRMPTGFTTAAVMLGDRKRRTIANNTVLSRNGDEFTVAYHGNIIARFAPGGVTLTTGGGWATVSTHERLNAMIPRESQRVGVHFFTRDRVGYVSNGVRVEYSEGATLSIFPGNAHHGAPVAMID